MLPPGPFVRHIILVSRGVSAFLRIVPAALIYIFGLFLVAWILVYGFFLAAIPVIIPMLARASFGSGRAYPIIYAYIATAPFLGGATGNILLPMLADGPGGFDAMFGASVVMLPIVLVAALIALRLSPQNRASE